jgi:hypothetical protein
MPQRSIYRFIPRFISAPLFSQLGQPADKLPHLPAPLRRSLFPGAAARTQAGDLGLRGCELCFKFGYAAICGFALFAAVIYLFAPLRIIALAVHFAVVAIYTKFHLILFYSHD